jgi:hypothetical protein
MNLKESWLDSFGGGSARRKAAAYTGQSKHISLLAILILSLSFLIFLVVAFQGGYAPEFYISILVLNHYIRSMAGPTKRPMIYLRQRIS